MSTHQHVGSNFHLEFILWTERHELSSLSLEFLPPYVFLYGVQSLLVALNLWNSIGQFSSVWHISAISKNPSEPMDIPWA